MLGDGCHDDLLRHVDQDRLDDGRVWGAFAHRHHCLAVDHIERPAVDEAVAGVDITDLTTGAEIEERSGSILARSKRQIGRQRQAVLCDRAERVDLLARSRVPVAQPGVLAR